MSHLIQVRGLKLRKKEALAIEKEVAPYSGAWIEIKPVKMNNTVNAVAPYSGAWIEISSTNGLLNLKTSHLIQVRGLKFR